MTASVFYVFNSGNYFGILEGKKDENNMKKSNYWPSRIPKYFPKLYIKSKKKIEAAFFSILQIQLPELKILKIIKGAAFFFNS